MAGGREPVYLSLPKGGAGGVHRFFPAYVFHQISSAESKARIFAKIKRRYRYGAIGAMPAMV